MIEHLSDKEISKLFCKTFGIKPHPLRRINEKYLIHNSRNPGIYKTKI